VCSWLALLLYLTVNIGSSFQGNKKREASNEASLIVVFHKPLLFSAVPR